MRTHTIGGLALLSNALVAVVLLLTQVSGEQSGTAFRVSGVALSLLFIIGLLALWPTLASAGRVAQVGLLCLGLAIVVGFYVRLAFLLAGPDVGDLIPLASAVLGCVGSVLVGWATIRLKTFHPIFGWLLIVGGTLNLIGGLLAVNSLVDLLGGASTVAQAGAFAGYGWTLLHQSTVARHATVEQA